MCHIKIVEICLLCLILALPVEAGIYKWIDENGKIHYTQKPPPKEGRRASINTENFNTVQTVKAPPIPKRVQSTSRTKSVKKTRVRRSKCPYQ